MNEIQKTNLKRLLAPRHVAFVGGNDADYSARQCAASFPGPVWGVNPKRSSLGGQTCYPTVKDLPEAPDAVFLATPRGSTIQVLQDLAAMGAGGVACFTAGFGELGEEGKQAEKGLVAAAGDLALVGPNCYGVISYINNAILWPFGAGNCDCERGIALIMQSGMISANLAMNQRSVPLAYVISAGNQSMLAIEDYIEILVEDPKVRAIGLYIEGIVSIPKFAAASIKALEAGKPVVVLKAGRSRIGSQLTVSHTGSLSGADEAHQALFDQLGIIRVESPEVLLETLKFLTISGPPAGKRIAAFSCSGGDALLVADYSEIKNLELPQPSQSAAAELAGLLPDIATVSNPLDYTTPLWGNTEVMPKVFSAALKDGFDAAIFVQDYAPGHIEADNSAYLADAKSYIQAVKGAGIPAGICSDLSENINQEAREMMVKLGVTPLQGIDRAMDAILNACTYSANRSRILGNSNSNSNSNRRPFRCIENREPAGECLSPDRVYGKVLNEWDSKQRLKAFGVATPDGFMVPADSRKPGLEVTDQTGFPVAVKLVSNDLAHKTELGVVALNLNSRKEVEQEMVRIQEAASGIDHQGYLIERMVQDVIHELLIGIKRDKQFGMVMVIASGGVLVELMKDSRTLLLPTDRETVMHALSSLHCYPLLRGYRGRPKCDVNSLVSTIMHLAEFAESMAGTLIEMDINPLIVTAKGAVAADALLRVRS